MAPFDVLLLNFCILGNLGILDQSHPEDLWLPRDIPAALDGDFDLYGLVNLHGP